MTPDQVLHADQRSAPRPRRAHEHDLRLVQVVYEEGQQTREFECAECGTTWYR